MPPGSKAKYTDKQKRKASHIEESYEKRGVKTGEAEERAWRTVNKQDRGGKKKTGSTAKSARRSKNSLRMGAKKTARRSPQKKTAKARS